MKNIYTIGFRHTDLPLLKKTHFNGRGSKTCAETSLRSRLIFITLLLFTMMCSTTYAQRPELMHYKFDREDSIINHASSPVGINPALIDTNSTLQIDTGGFMQSKGLRGMGGPPLGGLQTGWNMHLHSAFTLSFWYYNPSPSVFLTYLFGDSLADFHCTAFGGNGNLVFASQGGGIPAFANQIGSNYIPHMIHLVYDPQPITWELPNGTEYEYTLGTYTMYVDGVLHNVPREIQSPANIIGNGLVIGSSPGRAPSPLYLNTMSGVVDEFRLYNRALLPSEIKNTYLANVFIKGECAHYSHFVIDSISGTAAKIDWIPGDNNNSFWLEYDTVGFTPGTGTTITGSVPTSPVIISGLNPETAYDVYFGEICNAGSDSVYNPYPHAFRTRKACPVPYVQDIRISDLSLTTADLFWDHAGSLQEVYFVYGLKGFDPMSAGERDTALSLPHTLTNLIKASDYDVYIIINCGTDTSDTVQVSFTTLCEIIQAPYLEDFEDSTWTPGLASGNTNQGDEINPCWRRYASPSSSGALWGTRTGSSTISTSRSGPQQDNSGNGNYLYTRLFPVVVGNSAELYSPLINTENLNTPYLSFYFHRARSNQPDFYVDVNDGTAWRNVMTLQGRFQTGQADPYQYTGVDISEFGDTIQVRFRAIVTHLQTNFMGIDDFSIDEAPPVPPCPEVSDFRILTSTGSSVLIEFDTTSGNRFDVDWGPQGYTPNCFLSAQPSPVLLGSCITPNSVYDLYIRNNCIDSGNGVSSMTQFKFCSAFEAPYTINFDTIPVDTLPDCWSEYHTGLGAASNIVEVYDHLGQAFSGDNVLRIVNSNVVPNDITMLISPRFAGLEDRDKQIRFVAYTRSGQTPIEKKLIIGTLESPDKPNSFEPVDTIILSNSAWQEFTVLFDSDQINYNGSHQFVGIRLGEGLRRAYIDDFHYEIIPNCNPPSVTSVDIHFATDHSAHMNWKRGEGQSTVIEWGNPGFVPGTGNQGITADTFFVMTGLLPENEYEVYLLDSCNAGSSQWIGPFRFSTPCAMETAPFFEGFDGNEWVPAPPIIFIPGSMFIPPNYYNVGDTISRCWKRTAEPGDLRNNVATNHVDDDYYTWGVQNQMVGNRNDGTATDNSGSGNFIFTIPFGSDTRYASDIENIADFCSPIIDVSSLSQPYLSFYYHRYGIGMPDFSVLINDGDGWQTVLTLQGQQQQSSSVPFERTGIDLSTFRDTLQVRFQAALNGVNGRMAIDDFSIDEAPSCPDLTNLYVSHAVNSTDFDWETTLHWSSDQNFSQYYEITWGESGFAGASALFRTTDTSGINQFTIDTLTPGMCYDFYVRAICVSGDTSSLNGPYTFCVPCEKITAPYYEPFDYFAATGNDLETVSCWGQEYYQRQYSYLWKIMTGPSRAGFNPLTGPASDATTGNGNYLITIQSSAPVGDMASLYSPLIDLSELTHAKMQFSYHMFGTHIGTLHVDIFDGISWNDNVIQLNGEQQTAHTSPWKDTLIDLAPFSQNNTIQVRFRSRKTGTLGDIAIDDFKVFTDCDSPMGVDTLSVGCDSVEISWQTGVSSIYSIIEYGPAGFVPFTATVPSAGTSLHTNVSSPYVIKGLSPNTAYDVYVYDSCSSGKSLAANPVSLLTDSMPLPLADFVFYSNFTATTQEVTFDAGTSSAGHLFYWEFGDGHRDTGEIVTHVYNLPNAQYTVTLTVENGCGTDDTTMIIGTSIGVGLYELEESLEVYPNPNTGLFSLSFSQSRISDLEVELLDVTGKKIWTEAYRQFSGEYNKTFDFTKLSAGVYMMGISTDAGRVVRRIVIQ